MDGHDFRPSSASHNAVAARAPSAVLPASASVHLQRAACHAAVVQVRWDKAIKGFDEDDKAWNGKGGRVDLEDQYNTSFPNQIGPGKVNGKEFQNRLRMPTEEAPPEYPRHVLRCGRGRDHRRRRATQADGRIACNSTRRRSVSPAAEVPHDRRAPCARSVCHLNGEEVLAHRRRLGITAGRCSTGWAFSSRAGAVCRAHGRARSSCSWRSGPLPTSPGAPHGGSRVGPDHGPWRAGWWGGLRGLNP